METKKETVKSNITNDAIKAIVATYDTELLVKEIIDIGHGVANPVYIIKTSSIDIVLRVLNPVAGDGKPVKEELVYRLMKENGIPAPIILKTDISKTLIPYNYVLSKKLDGQALVEQYPHMSDVDKKCVVRELGRYLGIMHSITFDSFGDVKELDGKIVVGESHELLDIPENLDARPKKSWKLMHREILKSRFFYFKNTEFEHLIEPISNYFRDNEHLIDYDITPRLLHLDLNRGNIFVKGNKVTGILDVEESLIGHNEYDLMRTELHFDNQGLRTAFFEEYEKHVKLDEGYEQRRPFYSLSRRLVAIRSLVLWKDSFTKEAYEKLKSESLQHIKKVLDTGLM